MGIAYLCMQCFAAERVQAEANSQPITEQQTEAQSNALSQKDSKVKFDMYFGLNGNVGKSKGMDKAGGSIGLDYILGMRVFNKHLFIGPGASVDWYFYNDQNDYGKTKTNYMYIPIYLNARVYALGAKKEKVDFFLDTDIGGYIAIKPETTFKPKKGSEQKIEGKTTGGIYFHIGAGLQVSSVYLGAGYELKKLKNADNANHGAYFKIGVCIQ